MCTCVLLHFSLMLHNTRCHAIAGGPHDAAVYFGMYRILQQHWHRVLSVTQHGFFVGLCLQTAENYLSKSDMY